MERLLKAAERDAKKVAKAHEALIRREQKARARTNRAVATPKDERTLRVILAARRRSKKLQDQLAKNVAAKHKELAKLRRQALQLDRALVQIRRGLEPAAAPPPITGEQLRGSRALLQLSQREMAHRLVLGITTLRSLEKQTGELQLDAQTASRVARALELEGIELIDRGFYLGTGGPGLRLKSRAVRAVRSDIRRKSRESTTERKKKRSPIAA